MSYVSSSRALPVRRARRSRTGALRGYGDTDVDSAGCDPGQVWEWSTASCVPQSSSTGSTSTPTASVTPDQVNTLIAQINRFFDPQTPDAYKLTGFNVAASGFPTNGTIDIGVAMAALTLVNKRATDAYNNAKTTVDKAGASVMISQLGPAWQDPINFVTTNIGSITATIATYADLHGVPKAQGSLLGGVDTTTILIGATVVAALWIFAR